MILSEIGSKLAKQKRDLDIDINNFINGDTVYAHWKILEQHLPPSMLRDFGLERTELKDDGIHYIIKYNTACGCHPEDGESDLLLSWEDLDLSLTEYSNKLILQEKIKEEIRQKEEETKRNEDIKRREQNERKILANLKKKYEESPTTGVKTP